MRWVLKLVCRRIFCFQIKHISRFPVEKRRVGHASNSGGFHSYQQTVTGAASCPDLHALRGWCPDIPLGLALGGGTRGPHATAAPAWHMGIHSSLLSTATHCCASLCCASSPPRRIQIQYFLCRAREQKPGQPTAHLQSNPSQILHPPGETFGP